MSEKVSLRNYIGNLMFIDPALEITPLTIYELSELYEKASNAVEECTHHIDSDYAKFIEYLSRLIRLCDLLGIQEEARERLNDLLAELRKPIVLRSKEEAKKLKVEKFHEIVWKVKNLIKNFVDRNLKNLLLLPSERARINEAVHCLFEGLPYASVAMAAAAAEHRLMHLMIKARPDEEDELKELTFGQLIRRYLDRPDQYTINSERIIPTKHESVLRWINGTRILSVHVKPEEVDMRIARDTLSRVLHLLLDTSKKLREF